MRIILLCFLLLANQILKAQRTCGSQSYFENQVADRQIAASIRMAENFITTSGRPSGSQSAKALQESSATDLIRIPVVVHIVYHNAAENISDEQVRLQIEALNRDFRRKNTDSSNTPARFRSLAADVAIEFYLATADPYGGPTNGILRRQTTIADWTADDKVKFRSQGGSNAWDANSYLNIWVCNLRRITGYSSSPGSPADRDGIVISYTAFGSGSGSYTMGRTAVHEVGHWLGLKHIWGDSYCGDDGIDDTPQQGNFTPGCPTGFRSSCNNGTNGDMYMNYMDFTYDACINLFTAGQKNRMRACFGEGGPRYSLLNSKGLHQPWTEGRREEEEETAAVVKPVITLYPNPAVSVLKLRMERMNSTGSEMRVVNMSGITVMRSRITSTEQSLNIASLPAGNYRVVIGNDNNSVSFVKF